MLCLGVEKELVLGARAMCLSGLQVPESDYDSRN